MSYTRSFHHSVSISGSRSVSYPASEHGGSMTVNYADTVDMDINIDVDTEPFDESISQTNQNAEDLTMAVVGMQGAQIAAIRQSAQRVSSSMVNGFYNLTVKDITEQKNEEYTKLQTRMGVLIETAKALENKKNRMDEDTARMRRHYYALFNDMDQDLKKSLLELDRPAFRLAGETRDSILVEPARRESAFPVEQSNNTARTQGLLTGARLYKKVSDILGAISAYVSNSVEYRKEVAGALNTLPVSEPELEYIPAILCESESISEPGHTERQTYLPEMTGREDVEQSMNMAASGKFQNAWKTYDTSELDQIDQAFRRYVEEASDSGNSRVCMEMLKLWQNNQKNIKCL